MEKLYKIKEALLRELEDSNTARNGKLDVGELKALREITDTIKNIDKICLLEEQGYSEGGPYDDGTSYGRGSSMANRGKHWVRGHYSWRGGSSYDGGNGGGGMGNGGGMSNGDGYSGSRRDSRGRYSHADGRSEMMEHLEMAANLANEQDRENIVRWMRQLENV